MNLIDPAYINLAYSLLGIEREDRNPVVFEFEKIDRDRTMVKVYSTKGPWGIRELVNEVPIM